jgi:hypothetical protein
MISNKIKDENWMGRECSTHGRVRNVYQILIGEPEGKKPFEKTLRRWANIKINIKETGCEVMGWIQVAQVKVQRQALVVTVMNLRFP